MWDVALCFKRVQLKSFCAQCTFPFCLHFVQTSNVTIVQVLSLTVLQLLSLGDDVFTKQHVHSCQWTSWEAEVEWHPPTYFLDSQTRYMRISCVILCVCSSLCEIPGWTCTLVITLMESVLTSSSCTRSSVRSKGCLPVFCDSLVSIVFHPGDWDQGEEGLNFPWCTGEPFLGGDTNLGLSPLC